MLTIMYMKSRECHKSENKKHESLGMVKRTNRGNLRVF